MKTVLKIVIPVAAVLALIYLFYPSVIYRILYSDAIDETKIKKELLDKEPVNKEIIRFRFDLHEVKDEKTLTDNLLIINASKEEGYIENYDSYIKLLLKSVVKFHLFNQSIKDFSFYPDLSRLRLSYWEYVINQLPSFVYFGEKYAGYSKRENWISPYLAYLIYRFDRSPENIKKFFDKYKKHIYSCVTDKVYDEMHVRKYLDALISIYEQLVSVENHDTFLKNIALETDRVDSGVMPKYPLYKDIIDWDIVKDFKELYKYRDQEKESNTTVIWLYSFWVRRYKEGNSKVVYDILKEIREYYHYLG